MTVHFPANILFETAAAFGAGPIVAPGLPVSARWRVPTVVHDGKRLPIVVELVADQTQFVEVSALYTHATKTLSWIAADVTDGSNGPGALVTFNAGVKRIASVARAFDLNELATRRTGSLVPTPIITSAYTAVAGELVRLDSAGGGFGVALPAAPADGDNVGFLDVHGTWTANPITVLRNGKKIGGVTDDILLDRDVRQLVLSYDAGAGDWVAEFTAAFGLAGQSAASTVLPVFLTTSANANLMHVGPDKVVVTDVADSVIYTLQPFSVSGIPLNSVINLDRRGTGDLTVAAAPGVTLSFAPDRLARLRAPKTSAFLHHDPLNVWQLRGELDEV